MTLLLLATIALPFAAGLIATLRATREPAWTLRLSLVAAVAVVVLALIVRVDTTLTLPSNRALIFTPVAQLTLQLLALTACGLIMALDDKAERLATWLPVILISLGGFTVALLLNVLPIAMLVFMGATLLWAFGLPAAERTTAAGPVLRFAALLALAMPLLLGALRLAEDRLTATAGRVAIESIVLALAMPGFGLVLGLVPLHAWTLTLAAGAPRTMLFGILGLVQTAGFAMLLRTIDTYPWITRGAYGDIVTVGASAAAVIAAWLALSADPDDEDDWLAYAVVANMGMLVAGIGTGSRAAGTGVALLLLARVVALVLLALAPGSSAGTRRAGESAALLTLAGAPGLAGFPGLWLILKGAFTAGGVAGLGLAAASGLLIATAARRFMSAGHTDWATRTLAVSGGSDGRASGEDSYAAGAGRADSGAAGAGGAGRGDGDAGDGHRGANDGYWTWRWRAVRRTTGRDRAVMLLIALLIALGLAPQIVAGAFADPLRDIFFPLA